MSKNIPAALQATYDSGSGVIGIGLRIIWSDGTVYGFTGSDIDVEIDGVEYLSAPGLDVQSFSSSAGLSVDNTEITVLADDTLITRSDILAGRWSNAEWMMFRYDVLGGVTSLTEVEEIGGGRLGEFNPKRGAYVAELRGPQQDLQQTVGIVSQPNCRARFADYPAPVSDTVRCRLDVADFTFAGTVTSAASRQVFTDSARTEASDYFGEGIVVWTGGLNAGLSQKVKLYSSGQFTLMLPMIFTIQVGDTFNAIAGCRKRLLEDCRDKHDNVLNFQAEPHRPTIDKLTASPEANV